MKAKQIKEKFQNGLQARTLTISNNSLLLLSGDHTDPNCLFIDIGRGNLTICVGGYGELYKHICVPQDSILEIEFDKTRKPYPMVTISYEENSVAKKIAV